MTLRLASLVVSAGLAWGARLDASAGLASPPAPIRLTHGPHPAQTIDLWPSMHDRGESPLVIFVHGGGWIGGTPASATGRAKIAHALSRGQAFASVGYRHVPEAAVEDQAADVAAAIALLLREATQHRIDPRRVVVMGHSAGAHLAALIGTDRRWLEAVGLDHAALGGIVTIDGAAFDVMQQQRDAPLAAALLYRPVFGRDPDRMRALSPVWQSAAPNAINWLLLQTARSDSARQTASLAAALRRSGSIADVIALPGRGLAAHVACNRRLGDPGWPPTTQVDLWMDRVFASRSITARYKARA